MRSMAEHQDKAGKRPGADMWLLALLVLAGVCARGWILFSALRMPGTNGAYSLVQARSLLEKGTLGFPDYPFLFALQAGLATIIRRLTGLGTEPSIVLAVKVCLAALPPLAAIPVFLLGRRWSLRLCCPESRLPLVAAAMISFGAPAISMTGEFDKNALALLWLAGMLLAMHTCMERRSPGSLIAAALFLVLLGLTHIGAFGAGVLVFVCISGVYLTRPGARPLRVTLPVLAGLLVILAATEALVFWNFDPARVERLLGAITNPAGFMSRHAGAMPSPPGAPLPEFPLLSLVQIAVLGIAGAFLFRFVWRRRATLNDADIALVCGSILAILSMTGPWIRNDAAMRLALICVVPGTVVFLFVLLHQRNLRRRRMATAVLALLVVASGLVRTAPGGWRVLGGGAYEELKSLSSELSQPERTLIVAAHGLEWHTAWTLHTRVAQAPALCTDDWQRYDQVFFLISKDRSGTPPPPGQRGPRPPGPGFGPGPQFAPPPPGMVFRVEVPEGATIVHNGPHFTLARAAAPPAFVKERQQP